MRTLRAAMPSPSLVVAIIALVVALGGTSYAAFSLPKNSVGTRQVRKYAVTTDKIRSGAITAPKIADRTITGNKVNLGTLGTVPSANVANVANSAGNAGYASRADNAGNANSLGGSPASAYQRKIMWARVAPDGTLTAGSGTTSSGRLGAGDYEVTFPRDVSGCAYEATIGSSLVSNTKVNENGPGQILTEPRSETPDAVFVQTLPPAPVLNSVTKTYNGADNAFHLVVIC